MPTNKAGNLRKMQACIERIEQLTLELKALGQGVPAIEKNSRMILCAVYNLKFGVSDVADIRVEQGGRL